MAYTVVIVLAKNGVLDLPPFDLYYTAIIGNLVMFGTCWGAALVLPRREDAPPLDNLTVWTMKPLPKDSGDTFAHSRQSKRQSIRQRD